MYSHCPTCTVHLGTNRALEPFPVGRRLAFDEVRGRLWVLCPRCRSWNLVPLEDRWEAVVAAARLFETAAIGARTEEIALGRITDGTELVRIGGASEPEIAGWRYGRELIGRRRRRRLLTVASLGAAGALTLTPAVGAATVFWLYAGIGAGGLLAGRLRTRRPVFRRSADARALAESANPDDPARTADADELDTIESPPRDRPLLFRERDVQRLLLVPDEGDAGWRVLLDRWYRPALPLDRWEAHRALRAMLAVWNAAGGTRSQVRAATKRVVELGSADRVLARAARDLNAGNAWEYHLAWPFRDTARIQWADPTLRLALEMAAHDELERLALEGEVRLLEREWRVAEELASIADELFLPARIRRRGPLSGEA